MPLLKDLSDFPGNPLAVLKHLLEIFTAEDNEKQKEDIKRYDSIRFIDVNKEAVDDFQKKEDNTSNKKTPA